MPEPSRTRTFAPEDEASMTTHSRSARPLITSQAVAAGDVRSGRFAMKGKDGIRSRPSEPLSLLHRVIDRESVCPIGLLGDHGIRAAGHEGRDRAIVILDVELAVGVAKQLADFAHHSLLVLLGLRAGGVGSKDDLHGLIGMRLGIVP